MYTVATPLVWMSMVLFYATSMSHDILCVLANLGMKSPEFSLSNCQASTPVPNLIDSNLYSYTRSELSTSASWRWSLYQVSIIMPFTLSLLEMGLNKLYLDHRHSILVFLATVLYLVVNWLGSLGPDSREAYPSLLHW